MLYCSPPRLFVNSTLLTPAIIETSISDDRAQVSSAPAFNVAASEMDKFTVTGSDGQMLPFPAHRPAPTKLSNKAEPTTTFNPAFHYLPRWLILATSHVPLSLSSLLTLPYSAVTSPEPGNLSALTPAVPKIGSVLYPFAARSCFLAACLTFPLMAES